MATTMLRAAYDALVSLQIPADGGIPHSPDVASSAATTAAAEQLIGLAAKFADTFIHAGGQKVFDDRSGHFAEAVGASFNERRLAALRELAAAGTPMEADWGRLDCVEKQGVLTGRHFCSFPQLAEIYLQEGQALLDQACASNPNRLEHVRAYVDELRHIVQMVRLHRLWGCYLLGLCLVDFHGMGQDYHVQICQIFSRTLPVIAAEIQAAATNLFCLLEDLQSVADGAKGNIEAPPAADAPAPIAEGTSNLQEVPLKPRCSHSPDFTSVTWYGRTYPLGPYAAACMPLLWRMWEQGDHQFLSGKTLVREVENILTEQRRAKAKPGQQVTAVYLRNAKMSSFFRQTPDWQNLIERLGKSHYRLKVSTEADLQPPSNS